jgi:hypothetical protein
MAHYSRGFPSYARCRLWKNRWFWVVFDDIQDSWELRSSRYGYETTATAAEAKARFEAGPWAWKTCAYEAADFHKALRTGRANQPPPPRSLPAWCLKLGLTLPCRIDDVKSAYRRLARSTHPDAGGNAKDFIAIEAAYRQALDYCQRYGPSIAS